MVNQKPDKKVRRLHAFKATAIPVATGSATVEQIKLEIERLKAKLPAETTSSNMPK